MTKRASFAIEDADLPLLREAVENLCRGGFTEAGVRERLGLRDIGEIRWRAIPIYREGRLFRRDPLDLAIELFLLQGVLREAEMDRLFATRDRDALVRTGLLAGGSARASLFPVNEILVFSDWAWPELPHPGYAAVPQNHVMFVGRDSRDLARCTPRRRVGAALDLCTGSGVHALLAAAHADQVLAVDVNARAVACARFNAQALGIDNLEVAAGDLYERAYERARGMRFDLITANPPFVPSPLDSLGYRDGGRSGEDIQRRIVAGLPGHLAPGGVAQMVTELGEREGEPLVRRVREWLSGAAMDIHILRLREHTAENYAIGHAKGDQYGAFLESVGAWAGNLRTQGYRRVIALVITFQWSAAGVEPWDRVDVAQPPLRAAGQEIEAVFRAERSTRGPNVAQVLERGILRRAGPVALLDARLLGGDATVNAKATLMGQALAMEHPLDSVERVVLPVVRDGMRVPELVGLCGGDPGGVIRAIVGLIRKGLVRVDDK